MSLDLGQEPLGPDDCGEPENSRKLAQPDLAYIQDLG